MVWYGNKDWLIEDKNNLKVEDIYKTVREKTEHAKTGQDETGHTSIQDAFSFNPNDIRISTCGDTVLIPKHTCEKGEK